MRAGRGATNPGLRPREHCTQGTLHTGNTAHREHCTQGTLHTGNTAHREHCTQGTLHTGNTAHQCKATIHK